MLIFLLIFHFDIWDNYYFKSDLSLVLPIKMLRTKQHIILLCILNMKKQPSPMSLCLSHISLGQYYQKNVIEGEGFGKKLKDKMVVVIKGWDGGGEGVSTEEDSNLHTIYVTKTKVYHL